MDTFTRDVNTVLFPGFEGLEAPSWVLRELERGLGGVVLFGRNIADPIQTAALTAQLRQVAPGALVAVDEEGGDVTRIDVATGSAYPGSAALGAVDDVPLTRRVGASIGARLATVGIDWNLAPVADINSNPRNPVIGVRSFGTDPALVARHVAAYAEGVQSAGVAACAKHFPGHGDTDVDSHRAVPVVTATAEKLREVELRPFRAAIAAGVRSIMVAHLVVPAIDEQITTLSPAAITGVLREELGYDGVVITDALDMAAVAGTVGMGEGAVLALRAGADALCLGSWDDPAELDQIRKTIVAAVHSGRLSPDRLAEAAGRVRALARWTRPRPIDADLGSGLEAARRAVSVLGTPPRLERPLVIELRPPANIAAGEATEWGLAGQLTTTAVRLDRAPSDVDSVLGADAGRSVVVVVRDPHRYPWQEEFLTAVLARRPDAVVVDMGWPSGRGWPAAAVVTTYGAARVNAQAAAEILLGGA